MLFGIPEAADHHRMGLGLDSIADLFKDYPRNITHKAVGCVEVHN